LSLKLIQASEFDTWRVINLLTYLFIFISELVTETLLMFYMQCSNDFEVVLYINFYSH
jgi:hypothetical protein